MRFQNWNSANLEINIKVEVAESAATRKEPPEMHFKRMNSFEQEKNIVQKSIERMETEVKDYQAESLKLQQQRDELKSKQNKLEAERVKEVPKVRFIHFKEFVLIYL